MNVFPNGYRTCEYGDLPCFRNHCGGVFVPRENRATGTRFFGCSNYPECTMTRRWDDVSSEIAAKFLGEFDPDEPHLEHSW